MKEYFPEVVQVIPKADYKVHVYFDDGKIVEFDVSPFLDGEVFGPLKDAEFYRDRCTILNGTLAWDISGYMDEAECVDIDPFTLYELEAINHRLK